MEGSSSLHPLKSFNMTIILQQGASLFSGEIDDADIVKAGIGTSPGQLPRVQ